MTGSSLANPALDGKNHKSPLAPLFLRGKYNLLPLTKGGWEGF